MDPNLNQTLLSLANQGVKGEQIRQAAAPSMESAARAYGLPPGLLETLAQKESSYNPQSVSSWPAYGLMQFTQARAGELGIDPMDPEQAIWGAARHISDRRGKRGSLVRALEDYNRGPNMPGPMPDSTRSYIIDIMNATPKDHPL